MESVKDIFLRLHRLAEKMFENGSRGNENKEVQCLSFLNDLDRLREHCETQNKQITQLNNNIEKLQVQYEIVNFELSEANKKNQPRRRQQEQYKDSDKNCEMCKKTRNELDMTLEDALKIDQFHEEYEAQLKNHIVVLKTDNNKLKQDLLSCSGKLETVEEHNFYLFEDNKRLQECYEKEYESHEENIKSMKEYIELKNQELAEMKETFSKMKKKKVEEATDDKVQIVLLQAKCDDLKRQLKNQEESKLRIKFEKEYLERSVEKEANKSRNLYHRNDYLKRKLRHERKIQEKSHEERTDSGFENSINTELNKPYISPSTSPYSMNNDTLSDSSMFNDEEFQKYCSTKEDYHLYVKLTRPVEKPNSISYVLEVVEDIDQISLGLEQIHIQNFHEESDRPRTAEEELLRQYALSIQNGRKTFSNINNG